MERCTYTLLLLLRIPYLEGQNQGFLQVEIIQGWSLELVCRLNVSYRKYLLKFLNRS